MIKIFAAILILLLSVAAISKEFTVNQKNKTFDVKKITLKVGDSVKFMNNDHFFHNIFSLSDAAFFDLPSFPQGESDAVTFTKAGVVDIECAIHPSMQMKIIVR